MKPYRYAIRIINVILLLFFFWLFWMGNTRLPGQLGSEMQSDVMFQKYQNVCATLTASLMGIGLIVFVLINATLFTVYFLLKKSLPSPAGTNKANYED